MKAYFAGGCFWCMEKPYHEIEGVISVTSGYSGGTEQNPSYTDVKAQKTDHRETVEIIFDENRVTFTELFRTYLDSIDPFDDGGQFIDRGHSYTCAVYCVDDGQKKTVSDIITRIEEKTQRRVAVSVEDFTAFYPAEEYHLDYAAKHPEEYKKEYEISGRKAFHEKKESIFPGEMI